MNTEENNEFTPASNEERRRWKETVFDDFVEFSSRYLKIKSKKGEIIPLRLNNAQKKVYAIYLQAIKKKKPLRFIILKARQEGVSTLFEALIFHRTMSHPNRKAIIVGHELSATNNLFDMTKRFYYELPEALKPILEASNEKKLSFGRLKSEIKVATAEGGENVGRSDTIQDAHLTELAFWRDAKRTLLALLQTIPDEEETMVVLESTANGVGNYFYELYQQAKQGENDFIPVFLAWFDLPEYSRTFSSQHEREELLRSLQPEELSLMKTYDLSEEQINWRRHTIKNKCGGDVNLFRQEYPSNDMEAFISTGRTVFSSQKCYEGLQSSHSPLRQGFLEYEYEPGSAKPKGARFIDHPAGYVRLYKEITFFQQKDHNRYAAGCDVAEGLEQGDYSCIRVLDRMDNTVCLVWHGHIDPDLLAEEQHKIQLFLRNNVCFATEVNNHGLTTVMRASRLGVYQYRREDFSNAAAYPEERQQYGFKTTGITKPMMINHLSEAIREDSIIDREAEFWNECLTFVRNEKGQMQALNKDSNPGSKCFDDRVMAEALMLICHMWLPPYRRIDPEKEKEPEWLKQMRIRNRQRRRGSQGTYMSR